MDDDVLVQGGGGRSGEEVIKLQTSSPGCPSVVPVNQCTNALSTALMNYWTAQLSAKWFGAGIQATCRSHVQAVSLSPNAGGVPCSAGDREDEREVRQDDKTTRVSQKAKVLQV